MAFGIISDSERPPSEFFLVPEGGLQYMPASKPGAKAAAACGQGRPQAADGADDDDVAWGI